MHFDHSLKKEKGSAMQNKKILALWVLIVVMTLSCGVTSGIGGLINGSKSDTTVSELWPDVPPMEGMTKANLDLPLAAKLAIQGFIASSSKGQGSIDFISFTTSSSVTDLTNFYTVDRMEKAGWSLKDQSGCTGDQSGSTGGAVCFFGKENTDNTGSFLVIFAGEDSKTKQTQVFFMRVDVKDLTTATP
jgi:hypothetical protein